MGQPLDAFLYLQHLVRPALRDRLAVLDLTPVQNTVLHMVRADPGSSSAELARRTHVSPQTMHKLVGELERRGLLTLAKRPGHGRILDATLTAAGGRLLVDADACEREVEERMTAHLDESEREQLVDLLQRCIAGIGPPQDEPSGEAAADAPT